MKNLKSSLKKIVLFGILIRILLMPFFAHEDLVSIYTKAYWAVEHGIFHTSKFGVIWLFFHLGVLKIYSVFGLDLDQIFFSDPNTLQPFLSEFFSSPQIFRIIFLLKLPFLILELTAVYIFSKFFNLKNSKNIRKISAFWAFNPFLIYALYLHGRNEILLILFILSFLILVKKNKSLLASFTLGLAFAIRIYPIIFLPFFLSFTYKNVKKTVHQLIIFVTPLTASFFVANRIADKSIITIQSFPLNSNHLLPAQLPLGHGQVLFILPALLTGFFLWYHFQQKKSFSNFIYALFSTLILVISFVFVHPQYFSWLVLFYGITLFYHPSKTKKLLTLFCLQSIAWIMILFYWGKGTTTGLLQPIDFYLANHFGSLLNFLQKYTPSVDIVSLGRSILVGTNFYLIWLLFEPHAKKN